MGERLVWASSVLGSIAIFGCDLPPSDVWLCTPPGRPAAPLTVRGANLAGFSSADYSETNLHSSLAAFAATGGNWVALNFWWFQDDITAQQLAPDFERYSITDEALAAAVAAAQDRHLNILLRPMIDLRDGRWRGEIRGSAAWFTAYRRYVERYAALAAQWGVAAFSVGVELQATERHAAAWREVIAAVRTTYPGLIVYCANHTSAARVPWWDAVDVIGVDAYYAVAPRPGTSADEMACAWEYWLTSLERSLQARGLQQPVWLTEVGVRASRGAARLPWCFAGACLDRLEPVALDLAEQANYYEAVLRAAGAHASVTGVFWWLWYPDPHAPYVAATDYSPQGKPAEDVLREFWQASTGE